MSVNLINNFRYEGELPNFERDRFDLYDEMINVDPLTIDEGHISYCLETKKHNYFNSEHEWKELIFDNEPFLGSSDFHNGGVINLTDSSSVDTIYKNLSDGGVALCIIGDSKGNASSVIANETRINVNSRYCQLTNYFLTTEPVGANVGDILMITKQKYSIFSLCILKIIPLNDGKVASGSFAGTNGILIPWDKERINKVDGIESRLNSIGSGGGGGGQSNPNRWAAFPDDCLENGIYAWVSGELAEEGRYSDLGCGIFTIVVEKTTEVDGGGYHTIVQTAYGRNNGTIDRTGEIYKRIIFYKSETEVDWGTWDGIGNRCLLETTARGVPIITFDESSQQISFEGLFYNGYNYNVIAIIILSSGEATIGDATTIDYWSDGVLHHDQGFIRFKGRCISYLYNGEDGGYTFEENFSNMSTLSMSRRRNSNTTESTESVEIE